MTMTLSDPIATAPDAEFTTELVVRSRTVEADGVVSLQLASPDGAPLPAWEPGAHIDLMLADGLVRQYSLCGDAADTATWRVAVLREPAGRGGSDHVHDRLHEGSAVQVRGPRNHFALVDSPRYVLIAGGIGITPIMAMAQRLSSTDADWHLYYLGRSQTSMAFAEHLAAAHPGRVTVWADEQRGGPVDLNDLLGTPQPETLVYCCGPAPLLDAVEARCADWSAGALHLERFAAKAPEPVSDEALEEFQVECRQTGIVVDVAAGQPVLEALEDADIPIMSSCLEGVCGTCRATVLDGVPDHRDSLLTQAERDAGNTMLTCVSRSRSARLVLDL